jgi:hypothetical protein
VSASPATRNAVLSQAAHRWRCSEGMSNGNRGTPVEKPAIEWTVYPVEYTENTPKVSAQGECVSRMGWMYALRTHSTCPESVLRPAVWGKIRLRVTGPK